VQSPAANAAVLHSANAGWGSDRESRPAADARGSSAPVAADAAEVAPEASTDDDGKPSGRGSGATTVESQRNDGGSYNNGDDVNDGDEDADDGEDNDDDDNAEEGHIGSGGSLGAAMFSTQELLSLKLLFAIMDQDGDEHIERSELSAYAEESGDFAQRRELSSIIEALDSDGDGRIGLLDFVLFAARRKVREHFGYVVAAWALSMSLSAAEHSCCAVARCTDDDLLFGMVRNAILLVPGDVGAQQVRARHQPAPEGCSRRWHRGSSSG